MSFEVRKWIVATVVAGGLDLASAFVFSAFAGAGPDKVLAFVASGPFGDAMLAGGDAAMVLGVVVHFGLMAAMAAAFVLAVDRFPAIARRPLPSGIAYGLLLWVVMYWIVRPLRWPAMPLPHTALGISEQLFSHLALVGIPIALIVCRGAAGSPRTVRS